MTYNLGTTPFAHARTCRAAPTRTTSIPSPVEWNALQVRFFVNNALQYRGTRGDVERSGRWIFDQPFVIIMNLAVGGTFDEDPRSNAALPATMVIDYVRVYEAACAT
jgi:beta-glucanase (GH16 family)